MRFEVRKKTLNFLQVTSLPLIEKMPQNHTHVQFGDVIKFIPYRNF